MILTLIIQKKGKGLIFSTDPLNSQKGIDFWIDQFGLNIHVQKSTVNESNMYPDHLFICLVYYIQKIIYDYTYIVKN